MVSSRKRGQQEMESTEPSAPAPKEPGLLERLRNMWHFANLAQWIFLFGKTVKLDEDLDIEVHSDSTQLQIRSEELWLMLLTGP